MRLPHFPEAVQNGALALLAVGTAVLVVLSVQASTPPTLATRAASGTVLPAHRAPSASGKSVLVVSGGGLTGQTIRTAAAGMGWRGDTAVHAGAGISRAPRGQAPLAVAVRTDAQAVDDSMIVVQGGEFDGAASDRELEVAIYHLIDWVVAYKPRGSIFVLAGPIPSGPTPTPDLVRANNLMRLTAARRGVRYIDAIELGWTTGTDLTTSLRQQLIAASKPRTFAIPIPIPNPATPTATVTSPASASPSR